MTIKALYPSERPVLAFNFQNSKKIDSRLTYARASTGTFVGSNGLIQTAAVNVPRFEYDPITGEFLGLLSEGTRTNALTYSEQFDNAIWTKGNTSITANTTTAPDGTSTADTVVAASGFGYKDLYQSFTVSPNTTYTFSVFVKANGARYFTVITYFAGTSYPSWFDLSTGQALSNTTGNTSTITAYPNGWYKCTATRTSPASGNALFIVRPADADLEQRYTGTGAACLYLWGAQVEVGAAASSYIPTTSATVARSSDQISIATTIPATGSLFIDARTIDTSSGRTLLTAANSSNNKLLLQIQQPSNLYGSTGLVYSVNGTFKPTLPFPVPTTNRERNLITWGASNYHYRADQSRSTASNSVNVPASMNRLEIGYDSTDSTKGFNGYINSIYMWNSELQPAVAAGVVQGTITLKDADATAASIPAAALAMVFNTQGVGSTGDKNVVLPLRGSTNNIRVDWGDTTISTFIGSAATANVTKTYPSAGVYQVLITGANDGTNSNLKQLQFSGSTTPTDLYRIQQWGTAYTPTTMNNAFNGCSKLDFETAARTNLPDTSAVTDWGAAFLGCSSISGTFPTFNTTAATNFATTWQNCSGLTGAFPSITTSSVTNFTTAWFGCYNLTSFPTLTTSAGINFSYTWFGCSGLTSFPAINTAAGTNFSNTWCGCSGLTSFPTITTSAVTNFNATWSNCSGLTSFPSINTSAGTNFSNAWYGCSGLTSFPTLTTSAGTVFTDAWRNCTGLTSFPALNFSSATRCDTAWTNCSSLTTFPANVFNTTGTLIAAAFIGAFQSCALSATSIENILTSLVTNGRSGITLDLNGGTNAGASTWTAPALAAYSTLISRGWTISRNA